MLILSRVPPQKIIIGDKADVSICVLSVDEDEVQLGLVAAKGIPIHGIEKRKTALAIKIKALCAKISKIIE